jgi:hypothetical protein
MEPGIQSSFIPHDASQPTRPRSSATSGIGDLAFLVSIVLLVASAALAGAVFLYQGYMEKQATSKFEQIKTAKSQFKPETIHSLMRLDERMRAAEIVVRSHMAPLALFDALQIFTLSTVSFKSLNLVAADSQNIAVKMAGVAEGVNSVALQADLFSKSGVLTSPIFSDISRQVDGVHFNMTALVNPAAVNFASLLATGASAIPQSASGEESPFGGSDAPQDAGGARAPEGGENFGE